MKSVTLKQTKSELKQLAETIRLNRGNFKNGQRAYSIATKNKSYWDMSKEERATLPDLWKLVGGNESYEFRHRHLAYCVVRGRTVEQCEPKVLEGNERNDDYVAALVKELRDKIEKELPCGCMSLSSQDSVGPSNAPKLVMESPSGSSITQDKAGITEPSSSSKSATPNSGQTAWSIRSFASRILGAG